MIRSRFNSLRSRHWLRLCTELGEEPVLADKPTIYVDRGGKLRIGNRFRLSSRPIASHLSVGGAGELIIGNNVSIGGGAAIAAFQKIQIGDDTAIGPFVIIMDTNFHGAPGSQSVQHDTRPVVVGRGCRIGSRVTITRGAVIGDGAEILAGSVVSSVVAPGACVGGARARVVGQANELASRWESPAALLPELLMSALGLAAPPDLNMDLPAEACSGPGNSKLRSLIERHFGVSLDEGTLAKAGNLATVAAIVRQQSSKLELS